MKQRIIFLKTALAIFITAGSLNAQTLVAHYKFDNSISDETGVWNLTATDLDGSIKYEEGHDGTVNGAISGFDREDYLSTVTNFSISGDVSRTMTAWIKLIATTPQTSVVGGGINESGQKWTFGHQGNGVRTEINGKGAKRGTLTIDTWHHIATVWDKDNDIVTMYVDGVEAGTTTGWAGTINTAVAPMLVGNDFNADPVNRGFNGAMDDVRVYTGVADSAFILSIYNGTGLSIGNDRVVPSFDVYPNPVKDVLYFPSNDVVSVDVYNMLGEKIKSQKVNGSLNMESLTSGMYLVKFKNAEGENIGTVKTVKE